MFLPIGSDEEFPRRSFPIITLLLVATNLAVFFWELMIGSLGGARSLDAFIRAYGVVPWEIVTGRDLWPPGPRPIYLTLLTSMFMHAGWLHIIGNMLYLMVFGDNVEDRLGHLTFLIFYLIGGIVASLAQIAVYPDSRIPSIGASGAVAAVLGGYLVLFPRGIVRALVIFGPFLRITWLPAAGFILFWFFTQFLNGIASLGVHTLETGGVAYWAHIGGFIGGLILVWLYKIFLA